MTILILAQVTDQDEPVRTLEGLGVVASVQYGGNPEGREILVLTMTAPLPGIGALARLTLTREVETLVLVDRSGRELARFTVKELLT